MSDHNQNRDMSFDIPPIVQQLLASRGVNTPEDIKRFLYPDFMSELHDPLAMLDMDKAVARIVQAIEQRENVVIYGDYDIDGITATALLVSAFELWGLPVTSYIPDRFEEGYGINQDALVGLKAAGAELVISVDCGITSVAEAEWAQQHGLDLVITDHHSPPERTPEAIAVVNPKREGDEYPFKELAGVGVAYKLVQAVAQGLGRPDAGQLKWLLDLVALGTVCDVVTLTGENRALVYFGLKVLRQTRRVGLRALAEVAGIDITTIRSSHLGFGLGPRLNAAGRLEHAALSLELVLTTDELKAQSIAQMLDNLNQQRRSDQASIVEGALVQAQTFVADPVVVLAHEAWSHGIVGIAAAKVVEQVGKPVLVAQILGDHTKGSARSVPGFNIVEALRARPDLFIKFGGHAYAAGFTIATNRLNELRNHLNAYWRQNLPADLDLTNRGDIQLDSVGMIDGKLMAALQMLEPFGNGNPEPVIELQKIQLVDTKLMGSNRQHVRGTLRDLESARLPLVAFGWGDRLDELAQATTLIGTLNQNDWRGVTTVQFVARRIRA
ncbi:single-stranded-DNA-specific exonuclease RecJ [bacterium]|nr:MAG: single-stranded-DNA-specific exonuclease RecJ [bacterium]